MRVIGVARLFAHDTFDEVRLTGSLETWNRKCKGYVRAACGMASINARKALLTASGVVNTLDTSGSKATTTQD